MVVVETAGRHPGGVVSRPQLFARLGTSARVTVISAPAGSGKTMLLRSWIRETGIADRTAWVTAGRNGRDPQRFWLSVLEALRQTSIAEGKVQAVSAAPGLDGWALVERLLQDLAALEERLYLVVDDVHELGSPEVMRQLELLVMRAPTQLRFVVTTRHDLRLGLHRLRLDGELTEIRAGDLKFTVAEAGELLEAAGVELDGTALGILHERTEGWAAGLRLAALSLAGHPDPGRFAAEFSGTERTVAEYLLAEVLERQTEQVRRLLLRTSVLERVNGELAGLLTGDDGSERVLQDLEQANAFVVSLDPQRTWFRYHQLFASLLQLELRRAAPGEVAAIHGSAAGWFARNGFPVEAIRHAQAARDWSLASGLLADHWLGLRMDGQVATIHDLLAGFPDRLSSTDVELAVVAASDELAHGSLEGAERYLGLAERGAESLPEARREQFQVRLGLVRLLLASPRGDLPAVTELARRLAAAADGGDAARPGLGEDLRAVALIVVGSTEFWTGGENAGRHLERGLALARRIGRPHLEFVGLAYQAALDHYESLTRCAERAAAAIELGQRHGWTTEPAFGVASIVLGSTLVWRGRLEEAEPWVQRAEATLRADTHPAPGVGILVVRGLLELARQHDAEALTAFQSAERLSRQLAVPTQSVSSARALTVHTLVRLGEAERAEQELARLSQQDRQRAELRVAAAGLWLARNDREAALSALAPVLDRHAVAYQPFWLTLAHILEASARDAAGDPAAATSALERALDLAEPDGAVTPFLLHPVPGLLKRHAGHPTAHASLLAEVRSRLGGTKPPPPAGPRPLCGALSNSELRVLRYLPTNLTAPEIARELYVSTNTVKTHIRNLYGKLGTHRRTAAVEAARALGLLASSGVGRTKSAGPAGP